MNRDEIYNLSRTLMTDVAIGVVWPLEKVIKNGNTYINTNEKLLVEYTQMNAICAAYADYIWGKIQAE